LIPSRVQGTKSDARVNRNLFDLSIFDGVRFRIKAEPVDHDELQTLEILVNNPQDHLKLKAKFKRNYKLMAECLRLMGN
jgi:hypothetical protein